MADIIFYTNPMSRGQIARWMLEEVEADYEQVILDYGSSMKAAEYLAVNPMGKVPAIVHRGQVVTEGAAICAYLADAYADAGLAPGAEERAAYYRWLFFAAGPVESAITNNYLKVEVAEDQRAMAGYGSYDQVVDVLEREIAARDYVVGDRFTAADVYFGSQIIWGVQFGSLPKRAAFLPYVERLTARPAYQKAKAIDDALIAEIKAG
ncbi:glutathione S-transferase family protein [Sphingomonas sp.]|jgi:glutathione S-transferase|uniref:glutathione S-transferase family protein n=1 Tax=Sphingomonas sp. TaxID=28214 RepID=UPI002D7E9A49|nr:glutathione S-transferase family protein [Sphingomonas sp.]HEU0043473.1 glutathione S-transferase family protein [Sphingomonas sp.]